MSFSKFVWLIAQEKLYFARLDQHDDWWEGLIPKTWNQENQKYIRYNAYINCWHLSSCESDSMWKIYGNQNNETVAIKSSVGHIIESLKNTSTPIHIGKIDYNGRGPYQNNLYLPVIHKRKEFRHEKELRLCISSGSSHNPPDLSKLKREFTSLGIEKSDTELLKDVYSKWNPKGISVKVEINKLIQQVIISPNAGLPFKESVEFIIKSRLPGVKIKHSKYAPCRQIKDEKGK